MFGLQFHFRRRLLDARGFTLVLADPETGSGQERLRQQWHKKNTRQNNKLSRPLETDLSWAGHAPVTDVS
jgi:hypothetical protein